MTEVSEIDRKSGYRLLIVEDDEVIARSLKKWFEFQVDEQGEPRWNTDVVLDGAEAAEKIKSTSYHGVILDLQLPGLSGKEILLQCQRELASSCVLILTGHTELLSLEEALKLNVFGYFRKSRFDAGQMELSLVQGIEKKSFERFRSENVALLRLSREICHDIKNYLHPLMGFAELLELTGSSAGEGQQKDFVKHIIRSANAIKNLSSELFAFSNCLLKEEGGAKGNRDRLVQQFGEIPCRQHADFVEDVNIIKTLQRIVAEFSRLYVDNILFVAEFDGSDYLKVSGNEFQLERIIRNIILNSIEAILDLNDESLKKIYISGKCNNGSFIIGVRDNGPGISQEHIDKIFNPFFTTKQNGTGMGLYISRRLMNLYGGDIKIESIPGDGTVVWLHLPISPFKGPSFETECQQGTLR